VIASYLFGLGAYVGLLSVFKVPETHQLMRRLRPTR
jgi:hypothetical protein